MKKSVVFIFVALGLLYLFLCWFYVDIMLRSGTELNLRTLLPIPMAGIIIFVPLYKKYIKRQ